MDILYLASVCAQTRFDTLFKQGKITKMPQAQKYHHLLLEGLRNVSDDKITVISSYPVNSYKRLYKQESEKESNIIYIYPGFIHLPFLRQLMIFLNTICLLIKSNIAKSGVIVCDVLNGSVCLAARVYRFFTGIKIVGIVTDVPGLTSGARSKLLPYWKRKVRELMSRINKHSLAKYDAYLFLTYAMNDVVNQKNKPYIVIEGHSDSHMANYPNNIDAKTDKPVMMYAGGTHREFGIAMLVEAFISLNNQDWEFHIYGDGNYQNELKEISAKYTNIKYFGLKPNSEIIEAQTHSWLLVNPRITDAEYVKYSFPSKTLECMASGTPLLSTRLPGMPKEYHEYLYLFTGETTDEFKQVLANVFTIPLHELHNKGEVAKDFALKCKNNISQAEKLYVFISKL